jgi:hypothetical protein
MQILGKCMKRDIYFIPIQVISTGQTKIDETLKIFEFSIKSKFYILHIDTDIFKIYLVKNYGVTIREFL